MPEYIEHESQLRKDCPMRHENGNCLPSGGFCTAVNAPICAAMHNAYYMGKTSAADVVEVDVVKQWLYKIALNNVGVKFDGDFSKACEEIISRLDGLRNFSRELKEGSL